MQEWFGVLCGDLVNLVELPWPNGEDSNELVSCTLSYRLTVFSMVACLRVKAFIFLMPERNEKSPNTATDRARVSDAPIENFRVSMAIC